MSLSKFLFVFCLSVSPCFSQATPLVFSPQEENLFLRRIIEFWDEGKDTLTKQQIQEFLEKYPKSSYKDQLHTILAELAMKENLPEKAAEYYESIVDETVQEKVFLNHIQSLYDAKKFSKLIALGEKTLPLLQEEGKKLKIVENFLALAHLSLGSKELKQGFLPKDKNPHLLRAEKLFSSLLEANKSAVIFSSFARLYEEMDLPEKAVDILFSGAKFCADAKEDLLFQAAMIQSVQEPRKAVETFAEIHHLQGKKKGDAAYHKMLLLFDQKRYEEMLLAKDTLFQCMNQKQRNILDFFLGRCYEDLEELPSSIASFEKFLEKDGIPVQEMQHAMLSILHSSKKLEDFPRFSSHLQKLETLFPKSDACIEGYLLRARFYREKNKELLAKKDYEKAINTCENTSLKEEISYEYASFLYAQKKWLEAKNTAKTCLTSAKKASDRKSAWKIFVQSSIFATNSGLQEKKELLCDLRSALEESSLFEKKERQTYFYYFAKTSLELESFSDCIDTSNFLLEEEVDPSLEAPIYILLAESYLRGLENEALYCSYAEKAALLPIPKERKAALRLSLFNSNLRSYQKTDEHSYLEKAREHLFHAFQEGATVQQNNLLWLFEEEIKAFVSVENYGKNKRLLLESLFEELLGKVDQEAEEKITAEMASILEICSCHKKQKKILQNLVHSFAQTGKTCLPSTWISLGKAHAFLKEYEDAAKAYQKALDKKEVPFLERAKVDVELAKISFFLEEESRPLDKHSLLIRLKNLTLRKNLAQEPLHLEAALLYVDWSVFPDNGNKALRKKCALIQKMRKHFLDKEDVLSKEYIDKLAEMPTQETLFLAYMDLFDLEELTVKAQITPASSPERKSLREKGLAFAEELENLSPTEFFAERVKSARNTLSSLD